MSINGKIQSVVKYLAEKINVEVWQKRGKIEDKDLDITVKEKIADIELLSAKDTVIINPCLKGNIQPVVKYRVEKRKVGEAKPYKIDESEHNCYLVEGMDLMWTLICGGGGTAYTDVASYIGVGDSSEEEDEDDTGLQALVNKFWKGMVDTYPQYGSDKKATFRSVFEDGEAEFDWNEVTIVNSSTDVGVNLLRIVAAKGVKPPAEEWTAEIECTLQNPPP